MEVFRFTCEWDIGCNDNIYASEERLRKDVAAALKDCGIEESLEECEDGGLVNIELQEVIED